MKRRITILFFLLFAFNLQSQPPPAWNPNLTAGGANSMLFKFTKQVWLNPTIIIAKQNFEQAVNVKLLIVPRLNSNDTTGSSRIEKAFDKLLSFLVYQENIQGSIKFYFDPHNPAKPFTFGVSDELHCKFSPLEKDTIEQLLNLNIANSSNLNNFTALPFESCITQSSLYCKKILQSKPGSCGPNPENEFTLTQINTTPAKLNFERTPYQQNSINGGVDKQKYAELAQHYNTVIDIADNSNYPMVWKAMAANSNEFIKLKLKKKQSSFDISKLVFKNAAGTETYNTTFQSSDSTISLSMGGKSPGSMAEVVAYYTPAATPPQTFAIGAFNVQFYQAKPLNVVLVSLDNAIVPSASTVKDTLNKIYGNVFINWNVSTASCTLPPEISKSIHIKSSGLLSNYMPDMQPIVSHFKDNCPVYNGSEENTYYLLFGCTNDGSQLGYMPRARNTGFIFDVSPHTIAHELGHGAFNLKHIFSSDELGEGNRYLTNNIMDYAASNASPAEISQQSALYKHQWDLIHDPSFVGWFEGDDEEGASITTSNIEQLLPLLNSDLETFTFISPAGKPFTLPKSIINVVFYWNDDSKGKTGSEFFSDGALRGFTTSDGTRYNSFFSSGTNTFTGYSANGIPPHYSDDKSKLNLSNSKVIIATPCISNGELVFKARKSTYTGSLISADHTGDGPFLTSLPVNYAISYNDIVVELKDIYNSKPLSSMAKAFLASNNGICQSNYVPQIVTVANLINKYPDIFTNCFKISWVIGKFSNPNCTTCVTAPIYAQKVADFTARIENMVTSASNAPALSFSTTISTSSDPDAIKDLLREASYCDYTFLNSAQRINIIKTLASQTINDESGDYILEVLSSIPKRSSAIDSILNGLIDPANNIGSKTLLHRLFADLSGNQYKKLITQISSLVGKSTLNIHNLPANNDDYSTLQTSAFIPNDNWHRTFEWTDCWNRINPSDPYNPNNVSLNNCYWTPWEKRFTNITISDDGTITVTGSYDSGEEGITAAGDPPFNPIKSFTHTYHPYDLIVFVNKSGITSINQGASGGIVIVPALFLKFAYDKAFNQGLYDAAMISINILGILGIDELMLANKVLDRIPQIKSLIKWIWRDEVIGSSVTNVFKVGDNIAGKIVKQIRQGTTEKYAVVGRQMRGHVNDVASTLKTDGKYVEILNDDYLNYKFTVDGKDWTVNEAWDDMVNNTAYDYMKDANHFITSEYIEQIPMFKVNKQWVEKIQNEGYTIIDMGYPDEVTLESLFYNMEINTINWK